MRLGDTKDVKWKPDHEGHTLIIWTVQSALIIYSLEPLPKSSSVYNLPSDPSASFLSTGPADRIPFPKLVLKFIVEIPRFHPSEEINCLEITPSLILIGLSSPNAQLRSILWSSLHSILSSPLDQTQGYFDSSVIPSSVLSINILSNFEWLIDNSVTLLSITYSCDLNLYIFVTSDGRAYAVQSLYAHLPSPSGKTNSAEIHWLGRCFHDPDKIGHSGATGACALNFRFSLVALGLKNGVVDVYSLGSSTSLTNFSHSLDSRANINHGANAEEALESTVNTCAWTSDGHALAVSWSNGFAVWSVFGSLQTCNALPEMDPSETHLEDYFMRSSRSLFWGPGNFELFLLTAPLNRLTRYIGDDQLFVLPFAKSAVATLHSPDNTKHAFLQLDDRVSVYRGADCPDMSVINPESDIWQHIKIPADYISTNWPIECSCISYDGKLLAVAGKRGFTHFNVVSGRWKLFENEEEEQSIHVRGGMQWFENILVTANDEGGSYWIRLFGRENPLSLSNCLHEHPLPHPIILLSIYDSSLLVYTADNTLYHFLIKDRILLQCGSIGFEGVIGNPLRARGMSWLIPDSQHCFGEPENDLNYATIIFLIDGKVVLLRPRKSEISEVKYDLQILADRVEFYWAGRQLTLSSPGMLENSLWAWDGRKICVWLDALSIDDEDLLLNEDKAGLENYQAVEGRLTIPLNFHPLSVLIDKGIIIGIQQETLTRKSLNFARFRIMTNTELFIHQIIKFYLSRAKMLEAVRFGAYYSSLIYFGHSLEVLLHTVLEEEADSSTSLITHPASITENRTSAEISSPTTGLNNDQLDQKNPNVMLLPLVTEFLDHFKESLEVVVGCARKIDLKQWDKLFEFVGNPRDLFERSLNLGLLQVASSYLLILNHYYLDDLDLNNDQDSKDRNSDCATKSSRAQHEAHDDRYSVEIISSDTIRLFKIGLEVRDWTLCKELMRFLFSLDHTGNILQKALKESNINFNLSLEDDPKQG